MGCSLAGGLCLCCDPEDRMNELALADGIALRQPADLALSDRMHSFVTLDRSQCSFYRSEAEAGSDALFDESVILLDDVVHVWRSSATAAPTQFAGLLQFYGRLGVTSM